MVTVVIADDHPVVRAGLEAMLTASDVDVVASVGEADAAVDYCLNNPVDVVLMDLRFGESPNAEAGDGVAATRALRNLKYSPQVLIVTNYSTDSDVVGAISAGAVGYLLKDCGPEQLLEGIHLAARGESVMSGHIMGKVMGRLSKPFESLTTRELEVLELAEEGLSNKLIARRLVLTEATVKSHMAHIFGKLEVKNRTAAVAVARERGIL